MADPKFTNWKSGDTAKTYNDFNRIRLARPIADFTALSYFGNLNGKTIVDYGCGDGDQVDKFVQLGAYALGIDKNREMIESNGKEIVDEAEYDLERQIARNEKSSFIIVDCFEPLKKICGEFDFAFCSYFLHSCKDEERLQIFLRNAYKMLKSGGKIFIVQNTYLVTRPEDQEIILNLFGSKPPLRKVANGQDPFLGESVIFHPSSSETGRPFTREPMFSLFSTFWTTEKVIDELKKAGFVNVEALKPLIPDEVPLREKEQLEKIKEPFQLLVGAEKI